MATEYKSKDKMVNHPQHYQTYHGIEAIDVMEAFTEGLEGVEAVCTSNALKYLCRWKKKNGIEDCRKAVWYINRLISYLETQDESKAPEEELKCEVTI